MQKSIFEITIVPQTLNINNLRAPSEKSVNVDIIRKLIEYSLENINVKTTFSFTVLKILLFRGRFVLAPALHGAGSKRLTFSVKKLKKMFHFY